MRQKVTEFLFIKVILKIPKDLPWPSTLMLRIKYRQQNKNEPSAQKLFIKIK